jgi:lipopolysaccharide export system protein LptA
LFNRKPIHGVSFTKSLTLIVSLSLFICHQASAANLNTSDNRSAPIAIEADSAEQDEKNGVTIYRGNVSIEQGDLTIKADTVTIQSSIQTDATASRNISHIIANGKPARFTQQLANEPNPINAEGNTIRYAIKEGIILLEDNASIDQVGSKVTGEKIEYFIREERVKAQADPNNKNTRVHTIINPSSTNGAK